MRGNDKTNTYQNKMCKLKNQTNVHVGKKKRIIIAILNKHSLKIASNKETSDFGHKSCLIVCILNIRVDDKNFMFYTILSAILFPLCSKRPKKYMFVREVSVTEILFHHFAC